MSSFKARKNSRRPVYALSSASSRYTVRRLRPVYSDCLEGTEKSSSKGASAKIMASVLEPSCTTGEWSKIIKTISSTRSSRWRRKLPLRWSRRENQFSKALESVKNAIPQALLINGHNPLTLLHSALSEGLHAQTDEQCLELAHDVRVILAELAERLGQALKDEAELKQAVSRLQRT